MNLYPKQQHHHHLHHIFKSKYLIYAQTGSMLARTDRCVAFVSCKALTVWIRSLLPVLFLCWDVCMRRQRLSGRCTVCGLEGGWEQPTTIQYTQLFYGNTVLQSQNGQSLSSIYCTSGTPHSFTDYSSAYLRSHTCLFSSEIVFYQICYSA